MRNLHYFCMVTMLLCGITLTSCIKDDEPTGVQEMREAKAEYYRAEAAYKLAETAYQQALTAAQELENEAKKLENQLLQAETEAQIAVIKERLKTALLKCETAFLKAQADYDDALLALAETIAANNATYADVYAELLSEITGNRNDYRMTLNSITAAKLDLLELRTMKLDSASWTARLQLVIDKAALEVKYLTQQKDLLESVDGIAVANINSKMLVLNEEIRDAVVAYNKGVQSVNELLSKKAVQQSEYDTKAAKLEHERSITYNTAQSATITVPAVIQNDFITTFAFEPLVTNGSPGDLTGSSMVTSTFVSYNDSNFELYALKGDYKVERKSLSPEATTLSNSTTQLLYDEIESYLDMFGSLYVVYQNAFSQVIVQEGSVGISDEDKLVNALANLSTRTAYMNNMYALYQKDLATWNSALSAYKTAKAAYTYHITGEDYYTYATAVFNRYNSLTESQQTDAEKNAVITAMKAYAAARKGMDGWVHMTGTDETASTLELADFPTSIAAKVNDILGNQMLNDLGPIPGATPAANYEDQPYGAYIRASNRAFGQSSVTQAPVDAYELINSSGYGGTYGQYFDEYQKVNLLLKAQAWKNVVSQITAIWQNLEDAVLVLAQQEIADNKTLAPFQDKLNETSIALSLAQAEYGTSPSIVSYDNSNKTVYLTSSPSGTQGGYINTLVDTYNSLAENITNYETELYGDGTNSSSNTGVLYQLAQAQEELAEAKAELEFFKNGGYKVNSEYLVVAIEQLENSIANLEDEAADLNAKLVVLQKSLAAFLETLNARLD